MTATLTPPAVDPRPAALRGGAAEAGEIVLFLVAIALIALHVIDDNFLQPQPGTSPGDHLVSGLVPLALLGLAAWAYPRLRGGWRGALALALGVLGIAGGIEGFYYARRSARRATTSPGCSSLAAGLLLLGLGVVTLWRTRRTDGSRWWRYPRRASARRRGLRRRGRGRLPDRPVLRHHARRDAPSCPPDHLGVAYENVKFTTSDGLELEGWYVPSQERRCRDRVPRPQRPAGARRGCSPATATACCCSTAAAKATATASPNSWGWGGESGHQGRDRLSCSAAPDVDPDRIGGIGLSVGGEMMIETAAETDDAGGRRVRGRRSARSTRGHGPDEPALEKWTLRGIAMSATKTAAVAVSSRPVAAGRTSTTSPRRSSSRCC